jgi:transcriptional regulator with XRE-family HTH domain
VHLFETFHYLEKGIMIGTMSYFLEKLRTKRESLGISQKDAGALVDISRENYNNFENGRRTLPDEKLEILATAFGIPMSTVNAWRRLDGASLEEKEAVLSELFGDEHLQKALLEQIETRGLSITPN